MRERIVIIGDGALGLTATIGGARNRAHVIIMERMDRMGRKVLPTSNDRCSLTNLRMGEGRYRCSQKGFPMEVIWGSGVNEILAFSKDLRIEPEDRNGYIYPNSGQASAVLDVPRSEVKRSDVAVLFSCHMRRIEPAVGGGDVHCRAYTGQGILDAKVVILAAGSKAAPSTGSDGSGHGLARRLGHRVIKPLPALVQLWYQGSIYRQTAGIRTEAGVKLMVAGELLGRDRRESQLTDYNLLGIPIFQVSRFIARILGQGKRVIALMDLMSSWGDSEVFGLSKEHTSPLGHKTAKELFTGLLSKKLALVFTKLAGVKPPQKAGDLSSKQLKLFLGQMKSYEATVMSVNSSANAQVYCDGVDIRGVDAATMEPGTHVNLYLVGESLDVDGIYGGHNPQFVWSNGMIVGVHAAGGYFVETHEADKNRAKAHGAYGSVLGGRGDGK